MNRIVVLDSCVLIDNLRANKFRDQMLALSGRIRHLSVVLAELSRGARTETDFHWMRALEKKNKLLTPTERNWIESGELLAKMRTDHGFEPHKLRDLHFDVLIALTARSCGACLITSNRADFELIRGYRDFELEVW
jgi:predicted nucleic acid-binding protein